MTFLTTGQRSGLWIWRMSPCAAYGAIGVIAARMPDCRFCRLEGLEGTLIFVDSKPSYPGNKPPLAVAHPPPIRPCVAYAPLYIR